MATAPASTLSAAKLQGLLKEAQSAQLTTATFNGLNPVEQSQLRSAIAQTNASYMKMTIPRWALCEVSGGGQSASYNSSSPSVMTFLIPQSAAGWATELVIDADLNVNYTAAASSPTISVNAGAPFNAFTSVTLTFGSNTAQIDLRPYFAKFRRMLSGYNRSVYGQTLGQSIAGITALLYTGTPVASGNNTWKFRLVIPLNAIHKLTAEGIIPAMGNTGKGVIRLNPAPDFVGPDPLDSAINTNGTIATTGTVKMFMGYRDGHSLSTIQQMAPVVLGPAGIGTVQYVQLEAKQNLIANTYQRQHISTTLPMYQLAACLIDGNQSATFSTVSNVIGFEATLDQNGGTAMYKFDNNENVTMTQYYQWVRDNYGQDMDEGMFIVADAAGSNVVNVSNQDGAQFFNMTSNGYTAANVGLKVGSVGGVSGINPRYELWAIVVNPAGLAVK